MTKKREKQLTKIIHDYLNQEGSEEIGDQLMDSFALWFNNETDREEKDKIMSEIGIIEAESSDKEGMVRKVTTRIEQMRQESQSSGEQPNLKPKRRYMLGIMGRVAAVVIPIFVIVGVTVYWTAGTPDSPTYAAAFDTPYGATERHTLADSTVVTINAGSTLSVSQTKTERVVQLSGESCFSVTPDEKRPFVVKTDDVTITVLGTEFNVEAYPGELFTTVTLLQGKIALESTSGARWELMPGQQLTYDRATGQGLIKEVNNTNATAWTNGEMVCEKKSLPEILRMVERKFSIEIKVDESVKQILKTYTCAFSSSNSPQSVMNALKVLTDDFDYTYQNGKFYVTAVSRSPNN